MAAYFISDIHIFGADDKKVGELCHVLDEIKKDATHLLLLGDIFDLWVGGSEYFAKTFEPIVSRIKAIVDSGVDVHYIEGNHDFHLRTYWEKKLGVHVHPDSHELMIGTTKVRIEHGDFINPNDKLYFKWRKLMRSNVIREAAARVPGSVTAWIGNTLSRASRTRSRRHADHIQKEIEEKFKKFSNKRAEEYDFDLMVTGHVHVEMDYQCQSREARSVNLGYWDKPKAFRLGNSSCGFTSFK